MRYIFVDLEMNPLDRRHRDLRKICRNEIIEIGAVMLDDTFQETDRLKCYVKPDYAPGVFESITTLTGITNEMVMGAIHFREALRYFVNWCDEKTDEFVIYAWSESDLCQLKAEMKLKNQEMTPQIERIMENWRDYQKEFCQLIELEKVTSLERAVYLSGQDFEGNEHDALWDARNTANLFVLAQNPEKLLEMVRKIRRDLETTEHITYTLGDIFNFDLFDTETIG